MKFKTRGNEEEVRTCRALHARAALIPRRNLQSVAAIETKIG